MMTTILTVILLLVTAAVPAFAQVNLDNLAPEQQCAIGKDATRELQVSACRFANRNAHDRNKNTDACLAKCLPKINESYRSVPHPFDDPTSVIHQ